MKIKVGSHFIEVKNIINDNLKNGKKIIYFGGNIISTRKKISGKVSPPWFTEKYGSYFGENTMVTISN